MPPVALDFEKSGADAPRLRVATACPGAGPRDWGGFEFLRREGFSYSARMQSPSTSSQAAQRQLDAYNARDLEGFLAAYAQECVVRAHPSGEVLMRGRDEMRARYDALFRDHPALHCKLLARVEHESFVVDHERVEGLKPGEVVHAVAIYEVHDGLIHAVWFLREVPSPERS